MTDERTLDRLIAHLRTHVAELRRLEQAGAGPDEVAERTHLVLRLQEHLAYAVRDVLHSHRTLPTYGKGDRDALAGSQPLPSGSPLLAKR